MRFAGSNHAFAEEKSPLSTPSSQTRDSRTPSKTDHGRKARSSRCFISTDGRKHESPLSPPTPPPATAPSARHVRRSLSVAALNERCGSIASRRRRTLAPYIIPHQRPPCASVVAESGKGKDLSGMSCAGKGRGRPSQIRQDGRRSRLFVDTLQEQHCCSRRLDKTSRVPGGLGNFRLPLPSKLSFWNMYIFKERSQFSDISKNKF
ncbi:hypothetical protein CDAR_44061 [Caerostris darwini]|uniref:Uncharacterized protein n=1 Tax=Caerostris darwini TaxID=1538125 RepID=A0AAV4RTW5_9ARAC|nr:hypothetical protein CDAR_44061 [Caerostris darwini]